jgi:hypothetical protein
LLLIALAELNGLSTEVASYLLGGLFGLRVLHVELGLYGKGTLGYGRPIGFGSRHSCADIVIMGLSVLLLGSQDGLENVRGASSMHDERFRGNFRHRK